MCPQSGALYSLLRRRTLYPGEVRGLIQQIFNFGAQQDSNELPLRRRTLCPGELRGLMQKLFNLPAQQETNQLPLRRRPLYPTELRGLIQKIFNFTGLQDSNDSVFRRRSLYPAELQAHVNNTYSICSVRYRIIVTQLPASVNGSWGKWNGFRRIFCGKRLHGGKSYGIINGRAY